MKPARERRGSGIYKMRKRVFTRQANVLQEVDGQSGFAFNVRQTLVEGWWFI